MRDRLPWFGDCIGLGPSNRLQDDTYIACEVISS
jgi:hypothetical protein